MFSLTSLPHLFLFDRGVGSKSRTFIPSRPADPQSIRTVSRLRCLENSQQLDRLVTLSEFIRARPQDQLSHNLLLAERSSCIERVVSACMCCPLESCHSKVVGDQKDQCDMIAGLQCCLSIWTALSCAVNSTSTAGLSSIKMHLQNQLWQNNSWFQTKYQQNFSVAPNGDVELSRIIFCRCHPV
jgi:hypothetical protein